MNRDVLSAIAAEAGAFSKGQRRISKYITDNFDKAAFMTASKLGETVGVSESTVVRFAADLGYDGYPAMRKALQEMIKNRLTSVQRIQVSKELIDSRDVLSSVLTSDIEKIKMTLEDTNRDDFNRAVEAIINAQNIYILGLRSSASLANFMGFYLNLLFPNVRVVNESAASDVFEQMLRISKGDVFIAISFPRYSRRTIKAMSFASSREAEVIGITDTESSLVAQIADIKLYAKSEMVSFLDSLVAPLSLINALLFAAGNKAHGDLSMKFEELENIWTEYEVYEKSKD
ncbi:MAG: MurR/RpiR family transcriptional regulator [Oscillospiraceae bacterium]